MVGRDVPGISLRDMYLSIAASNRAGQTWCCHVWQQQLSQQKWSQVVCGKSKFMTLLGCTVRACKHASIVDLQCMRCMVSAGKALQRV